MGTRKMGFPSMQIRFDVIVTRILLTARTMDAFTFRKIMMASYVAGFQTPSTEVALPKESWQRGQCVAVFVLVEKG